LVAPTNITAAQQPARQPGFPPPRCYAQPLKTSTTLPSVSHEVRPLLTTASAELRLHSAAGTGDAWSDEYLVDSPRLVLPLCGAMAITQSGRRLSGAPLTAIGLDRRVPYRMRRFGADVVRSLVIVPRAADAASALATAAFGLTLAQWASLRTLVAGLVQRRATAAEMAAADALIAGLLRNDAAPRTGESRAVHAALAVTAAHSGKALPLATVAAAVHSSPFHLARQFRRATGRTLRQTQLDQRVAAAMAALEAGADDLSRLAHELGFSSHAHFTQCFRERTGVTPSAFRAACGWAPAGVAA